MDGAVEQAKRDALAVGVVSGVLLLLFGGLAASIVFVLGLLTLVVGAVLCITVVGILIGLPLILIGALLIVGSSVGGPGGLALAAVAGAGCGALWYRHRLRELGR
jgi:hypothetical protein